MASQEMQYIKEQAISSKEKEKRALYSEALKFLNSPKIKNLPQNEYELKVKEVMQIIKNKEKEGLKRQTITKIDFLKLSMELESKREPINQEMQKIVSKTKIELLKDVEKLIDNGKLDLLKNYLLKDTQKRVEFLAKFTNNHCPFTKELHFKTFDKMIKEVQLKQLHKIKVILVKKLGKEKGEKETLKIMDLIEKKACTFDLIGYFNNLNSTLPKNKKITASEIKIVSENTSSEKIKLEEERLNEILNKYKIPLKEINGKKSDEIKIILKKYNVNQDDQTIIFHHFGHWKSAKIMQARSKAMSANDFKKASELINKGVDQKDIMKALEKQNKKLSDLNKQIKKEEDPLFEPKKEVKPEKNPNFNEPKSQNYEKLVSNIDRNTTVNIQEISYLPATQRKEVFDKIFANIDKGQPKKLIAGGIEFSISGNKGNYEVRYGDRIISGLSREKVKESISFARFLKPLGMDFLIGHSTKIINRINEVSTKGLKIHDEDGMNILEQDLCLEKLGKAILGDNYKHKPELEENKEQLTRIKSNPIKYNNSNFSSLELLAKEKFRFDSGNELNIQKLLTNIV